MSDEPATKKQALELDAAIEGRLQQLERLTKDLGMNESFQGGVFAANLRVVLHNLTQKRAILNTGRAIAAVDKAMEALVCLWQAVLKID